MKARRVRMWPKGSWPMVVIIGLLVGVASARPGAVSGAPSTVPKRGGELRVMLIVDSQGMDPAKTTEATAVLIGDVIFDTLVETTAEAKIVPSLAESWTVSPDRRVYTFRLRRGVKFHNGREMTSTDVRYTIERIKDRSTRSPRITAFSSVQAVETPDAYTVVFRLDEVFAPLLSYLSHVSAGIVPREVVEAEGDLSKRPVGTGSFKFVEWVRDQRVVVEANRDYWRQGLPRLDRIVFTFNADENARAAAVRSGTVDFLYAAPSSLIGLLRRDPSLVLHGGERTMSWLYYLMNIQKEPFKDLRVRNAIFSALDRKALADIGRPGTSTALMGGFLPPTHWAGLTEPVWRQDLGKAKQFLAEAGHASGFKFTINALTGWDFQIRTAQAIQQQLRPLGIDAEVRILEAGQLLAAARTGEFQSQVLGFSGTLDPDERFQQTFVTGGGTNWARFSDPALDQMVMQARRTNNQAVRARLYREAQHRLTLTGPMAFLYIYHNYDVLRNYVKDYTWNPAPMYRSLREVWLDR